MEPHSHLQILQRTDLVSHATLQAAANAVTVQVHEHFAPAWGLGDDLTIEVLGPDRAPADDAWWLAVVGDSDDATTLGYHDLTATGAPMAKVFARPLVEAGLPVSGAISHEVLEALADPLIEQWAYDDRGAFWARETSDAVQGSDYPIHGVTMGNFVYPSFFRAGSGRAPYDYRGLITQPLQTLPDGYQLRYTRARGFHQVFGRRRTAALLPWRAPQPPPGSRRERRIRGHGAWRRSTPVDR